MPTQGKFAVGPRNGRLVLRTTRQGLASQVGHDLTIEVTSWSGEVKVPEDPTESTVNVTVDTGSLTVLAGTGGVKPLSERDKREIAQTTRKLLQTDRHPEGRFVSTAIKPNGQGGVLEGTLTLLGVDRPVRLEITDLGDGRYQAKGTVVQSEFGIKPYSALLGALKLADPVEVEAEFTL